MKITKFEQSGFVIENNNGFRLAFDIGSKTPVEHIESVGHVDAFLVSHIHGDHFTIEHIKKINPKNLYLNAECRETLGEDTFDFPITTIQSGETLTLDTITVTFFDVDHGPNIGAPLKENFGFLITIDGQKIYFAGDMFYASGIDVQDLEVDIALLPVGTFYTFGPQEAYEFARSFKKIGKIISMHYENKPETHGQFLALAQDTFHVE